MTGVVGADTPRNRADEEERVKANALPSLFLSLFVTTYVYTGKEQSLLSTTREIGSSIQSETRARVRVCGLSIRVRTHTLALCTCGVVHCQAEITETQIGRCDCDGRRREPRAAAVL